MRLYFTKDHEWIAVDGGAATVGITDYAQAQLGDVVFVELPPVGSRLRKGQEAVILESVKAASDVFSPLTGVVTDANRALESQPSLLNISPEAEGWLFRIAIEDARELAGLLDDAKYRERVRRL